MSSEILLAAPHSRPHHRSFLTVISVMILIGAEVFGVAFAGGWALAGLLDIGDIGAYGLMGLFGLIGAYLMVQLWHRAVVADQPR